LRLLRLGVVGALALVLVLVLVLVLPLALPLLLARSRAQTKPRTRALNSAVGTAWPSEATARSSPPLWLRRGAERFADQGSQLFERSEFCETPRNVSTAGCP